MAEIDLAGLELDHHDLGTKTTTTDMSISGLSPVEVDIPDNNGQDSIQINSETGNPDIWIIELPIDSHVTIVALPGANRLFSQWAGGPCDGSTNATCTFLNLATVDETMTAVFIAAP